MNGVRSIESGSANEEREPNIVTVPSATESLLHPERSSLWPREITENETLVRERETRLRASERLSSVFSRIPDVKTDIDEAIRSGRIPEGDVNDLYASLVELFASDPENARLALYLPFELLPKAGTSEAGDRFLEAYRAAWRETLRERDHRADFFDGDIPEPELEKGPPPTVVKGAHLIPDLVLRGTISIEEALAILDDATDETLIESVLDAISVLGNRGALKEDAIVRMESSVNPRVRGVSKILRSRPAEEHDAREDARQSATLEEHARLVNEETAHEDERIGKMTDTTEGRSKWLAERARERIARTHGRRIAEKIEDAEIDRETLESAARDGSDDEKTLLLEAIEAMFESTESDATYESWGSIIEALLGSGSPLVAERARTTLRRLYFTGKAPEEAMERHGLETTPLHSPSGIRSGEDETRLREMTDAITREGALDERLFPVALLIGSRMKGYAEPGSDLDTALFVRPGVPYEEREELERALSENVGTGSMLFYLEEREGGYAIRDFMNPDERLGDSTLAHPLIAPWTGEGPAIEELYRKLMPGYLMSEGRTAGGEDARRTWLRGMEHELLQYRLMHKGYRRLHIDRNPHGEHEDAIDGESAFYDPGYRRIATKLFIDRVFLPQVG